MDRYKIHKQIGKGAFGEVYEIKDLQNSDMLLACKLIKDPHKDLILREIEYLKHLTKRSHGTTLKYVDHFTTGSHLVIVTERLGISVFDMLKENNYCGFEINLIRNIMDCLFSALGWVHDEGIMHCDVKPENLLLDMHSMNIYKDNVKTDLHFKLIDFGSSTRPNHLTHSYIQSRFYRAPEVMLGSRYNEKIDIWSAACVMIECLTGKPLFNVSDEWELLDQCVGLINPKQRADWHEDFKSIDSVIRRSRKELDILGGVPDIDDSITATLEESLPSPINKGIKRSDSLASLKNSVTDANGVISHQTTGTKSSASVKSFSRNFVSRIPKSPEKTIRMSKSMTMSSLSLIAAPLTPPSLEAKSTTKVRQSLHAKKSRRQSFIPLPIRELEGSSRSSQKSQQKVMPRSVSFLSLTAAIKTTTLESDTYSTKPYHRKKAPVNKNTLLFKAFTAFGTINYPYLHHRKPSLKFATNSWSLESFILNMATEKESKNNKSSISNMNKRSVGEMVLAFENVNTDIVKARQIERRFNRQVTHENKKLSNDLFEVIEIVEQCIVWDKWNRPGAWELLQMKFFRH